MRVCILSMQRVPNMGSLLQSYALKKIIENYGHTVTFIDIEKREEDYKLLEGNYVRIDDELSAISRLWNKVKKFDRYAIQRIENRNQAKKQRDLFHKFSQDYLLLDETANSERFDLCVIGSDEVFNCCSYSPWGLTSQLFGNVSQAKHIITYAASCGFTKIEMLNDKSKKCISNAMKNLEEISVRDNNTYQFVKDLGVSNVLIHLDPVLIYDFDSEVSCTVLPPNFPSNACIIYAYYNRIQEQKEINSILSFCKKNQLVPVAVGAPQMWIKDYYPLSPFQALKAISRSSFVVTDTFHGTIFATKYAKNFGVIIRDNNENKLKDLLKRLGLENHLISDNQSIDYISTSAFERENVRDILYRESRLSMKYFEKYLLDRKTFFI